MDRLFGKQSMDKLIGVDPRLVDLCVETLKISPYDFSIVQGVRTQKYQDSLYCKGRTTAEVRDAGITNMQGKPNEKKVTWTRTSKHIPSGGFGRAIDFAAFVDGRIDWDVKYYPPIVLAFKETASKMGLRIICGADWKTKDWGHVQRDL